MPAGVDFCFVGKNDPLPVLCLPVCLVFGELSPWLFDFVWKSAACDEQLCRAGHVG
jgi:hypothetical protein